MTSTLGLWKPLCSFLLAALISFELYAQAPIPGLPADLQCHKIASNDVAAPEFVVENFDKKSQAFLVCRQADNETTELFFAGTIALKRGDKVSLEDFIDAFQEPPISDVFIQDSAGMHKITAFNGSENPLDLNQVDSILGTAQSRVVKEQVCKIEYEEQEQCTQVPKEVCKIVYGRKECTIVYEEVCTDVQVPIETCQEQTVVRYYRRVPELNSRVLAKPDGFCPLGMVEKQTRTEYGRVINERRCCESKVIDGELQVVCGEWQEF